MLTRPKLPQHLRFVWQAFFDLSTDRQIGQVMGPIPWASIDRYAARYSIHGNDEFEQFAAMIRTLDLSYREYFKPKDMK